jgi:hypothetical protein
MSLIDQAVEIDRELRPEQYAKADAIARIIDPSAFAEWYDGTGPDAKLHEPDVRQRYMQSAALTKAFEVLRLLKLEPETFDWNGIFEHIARRPPEAPRPSQEGGEP